MQGSVTKRGVPGNRSKSGNVDFKNEIRGLCPFVPKTRRTTFNRLSSSFFSLNRRIIRRGLGDHGCLVDGIGIDHFRSTLQ